MRVVVTGANGMLGRDMVSEARERDWIVTPLGSDDLDITAVRSVRAILPAYKPDVVINCAAFTNVDGAESSREQAFAVNGLGPRNLALACREMGSDLVQISTDYVFDGRKENSYGVYDQTQPLNVYGASKLWGERVALSLTAQCYVIRTSWLFGLHGKNFVATMLRLGKEMDTLKVVHDQYGCPTYTPDLARAIAELIESRCYGVYHVTNQGTTTWFELARKIMVGAGLRATVHPCSTAEFPRIATRPQNSVLDPFPLRETIGYLLPTWEDALKRYLSARDKEVVS